MPESIFIKVVGFNDVERHALNTVFRLSEERPTSYCLWTPAAPSAPRVAFLDGQSYQARLEAESPQNRDLRLIWIGEDAPAGVWRSFRRPLSWPDVVQALDGEFTPDSDIDFDLALDEGPPTQPPEPEPPAPRALIASADPNERLYLRAKLALHGLARADEAESAAQVQELLRDHHYAFAVVDFDLPDSRGWELVRELAGARQAIAHLLVTKQQPTVLERLRARIGGLGTVLRKPVDPGRLGALLERL